MLLRWSDVAFLSFCFPVFLSIMVAGVPVMDPSPVQAAQATKSPNLIMDWHEIEDLLFEKRTLA